MKGKGKGKKKCSSKNQSSKLVSKSFAKNFVELTGKTSQDKGSIFYDSTREISTGLLGPWDTEAITVVPECNIRTV